MADLSTINETLEDIYSSISSLIETLEVELSIDIEGTFEKTLASFVSQANYVLNGCSSTLSLLHQLAGELQDYGEELLEEIASSTVVAAQTLVDSDNVVLSVGDGTNLLKFSDGVPELSTSTVGDVETPVYLKDGILTECEISTELEPTGSSKAPIYIDSDGAPATLSSVGSSSVPVYVNAAGAITAVSFMSASSSKVNIGYANTVSQTRSNAVGYRSYALSYSDNVFGSSCIAGYDGSSEETAGFNVALGTEATAKSRYDMIYSGANIAIGYDVLAASSETSTDYYSGCNIAIGRRAVSEAFSSISLGHNASAANGGIAIGLAASATGGSLSCSSSGTMKGNYSGIALGQNASVSAAEGIAIGFAASVSAADGIAIGYAASAANGGIAIGYAASAANGGIAIGYAASAGSDEIALGTSTIGSDSCGIYLKNGVITACSSSSSDASSIFHGSFKSTVYYSSSYYSNPKRFTNYTYSNSLGTGTSLYSIIYSSTDSSGLVVLDFTYTDTIALSDSGYYMFISPRMVSITTPFALTVAPTGISVNGHVSTSYTDDNGYCIRTYYTKSTTTSSSSYYTTVNFYWLAYPYVPYVTGTDTDIIVDVSIKIRY